VRHKSVRLREHFAAAAACFPVCSITALHNSGCGGALVVIDNSWPMIVVRCDRCGQEASYPAHGLAALPQWPYSFALQIPDVRPQAPAECRREPQSKEARERVARMRIGRVPYDPRELR